jgi:hypothetical protein
MFRGNQSFDITESEIPSYRDALRTDGFTDSRSGILEKLEPGEYCIMPRFPQAGFGPQLADNQGRKLFSPRAPGAGRTKATD